MVAPIISEEGRGLIRKKKKHRVSEPGALVIEHAELSDTGQSAGGAACSSIKYYTVVHTNTVLLYLV